MTNSRKITQIILITFGLLLIFATYFFYPKMIDKKKLKDKDKNVVSKNLETEIKDDTVNRFEEVTYKGVYDFNKTFTVQSTDAYVLDEEPDVVHMNNMEVNIYMNDGRVINITSDKGSYNKVTYDCFFEENVKATDGETIILSENVDLISSQDTVTVYNDVIVKSENNSLVADKVTYNFESRRYRISMFEKNEKVKAKLVQ